MTHPGLRAPLALVHVVAVEEEVQLRLITWLKAAGIDARIYNHLRAFLSISREQVCTGMPECLLIDAQPSTICGLEAQAILLLRVVRCPIVVAEKPLCEQNLVAAIGEAIEADRRQRLMLSRRVQICMRYSTLTPRERQVMSLVVSGLMNKQVGGDLGVTEITVKAHRGSLMRKMGARSLAELVRMADAITGCAGDEMGVARNERSAPARSAVAAGLHTG
jgi:FixJ family two-component response regulator